jgi:hypothetical protein
MPSSLNVAKGSNNNHGRIGFANDGWWGIEVKPQKYAGSFYVQGAYEGDFDVSLQSKITQEVFATAKVKSSGAQHKDWVQYKYELLPKKSASNTNNTLTIAFDSKVCNVGFNLMFCLTCNVGIDRRILELQLDQPISPNLQQSAQWPQNRPGRSYG